mmetsp:Transcript_4163/g.7462  ORF Transcript_4163/g.7462 Transcript_4163/m.7462 type:complete len:524 (-) Transcript_4163:92-1663(-)
MITVVNNNNNMSDSTPQAVISKMPPPQKDDVHFFGAEDERKPAADEVEIIGKVCGVDVPASIPLLDLSEVRLGSMLGTGGFCSVWYVRYISCLKQASPTHQESHHQKQARHRLALWFAETKPLDNPMNSKGNVVQPLVRKPQQLAPGERPPPRLALKKLLLQDQTAARIQGAQRDLETEISILLQLGSYDANTKNDPGHNNIVKIFAIGTAEDRYQSNNNNSISDDNTRYNFFVMDRLVSTLSSRMNKWRDTRGSLLGLAKEQWQGNFNRELWLERMIAIQSIGSAVSYMHSKSILFRDLKPDNVGFDMDGTLKLFDFGLAKRVSESQLRKNCSELAMAGVDVGDDDDAYVNLTADTGSRRYMSPEVYVGDCYGKSADVYSMGIVMYEILSLKIPFPGVSATAIVQGVMDGDRPPMTPAWPFLLQSLMVRMWDGNRKNRPTMAQVVTQLSEMLRGGDSDLYPSKENTMSHHGRNSSGSMKESLKLPLSSLVAAVDRKMRVSNRNSPKKPPSPGSTGEVQLNVI